MNCITALRRAVGTSSPRLAYSGRRSITTTPFTFPGQARLLFKRGSPRPWAKSNENSLTALIGSVLFAGTLYVAFVQRGRSSVKAGETAERYDPKLIATHRFRDDQGGLRSSTNPDFVKYDNWVKDGGRGKPAS